MPSPRPDSPCNAPAVSPMTARLLAGLHPVLSGQLAAIFGPCRAGRIILDTLEWRKKRDRKPVR